ncbi:MAG: Gfo/Idh/MocA family oxidoreductase, partial [Lachnospiraceae bacterium]|nr:Gfo/Idh/MocA family oxidoreductase [Lachnospiraceae bacterium]
MSIRLGIIGTGRIASRAVNEIEKVDGLKIAAVMNPNVNHAREFADKFGIVNVCEGIEEFRDIVDA